MSTSALLSERLWLAAAHQAASLGFTFAPNCEAELRSLLAQGATQVTLEGFDDDAARVALAEANARVFVTEMVLEAKAKGYADLHEDTFAAARRKLCPIWPFCKAKVA